MGSSLCLAVRKKKKKETIALPEIPEQVLIEILIRLPAKSLMRYKCVSKLWLSLIISPYFTNLFLKSSSRRRLFAYIVDVENSIGKYALLTSSSSSSSHDHSVSVIDQNLSMPGIRGGNFENAVRGLVCFRIGRRVKICNFLTRQLVELPIIRSQVKGDRVWNYCGHDPVHDVYKVLSLVWELTKEHRVRLEHHVLVLGAGASWKNTQCHTPHPPYTRGISINGVLYYGARTYDENNRYVLMSFDLTSEEFNLIELHDFPGFGSLSCIDLMNYKGRVAIFNRYRLFWRNSSFLMNVWVLEDADKNQWSIAMTIILPVSQMNFTLDGYQLNMDSTSRTGKVPLREVNLTPNQPVRFFGYDIERNEITPRIEVKPSLLGRFKKRNTWLCSTFWDDIENIMYLET